FNTAASSGGGLESEGDTEITGCTISGNTSLGGRGGGIRQSGQVSTLLQLTNTTISGNHADQSQGGGLFLDTAIFVAHNNTISGNSAGAGGGLFLDGGLLSMFSCTISGNRAANAGGGIIENDCDFNVSNSTIAFNRASSNGGILGTGGLIRVESDIIA